MDDVLYMQRALQLAALGLGKVSPNPLVGCVIVKDQAIIGEGYHQKYGEGHAEVNAVNSVNNQKDLVGATAFVTLEPCAHVGKTPPCADLLIKSKISRVVIAHLDPNPLVGGKGAEKLRKAGIDVEVGLLEKEATHQNRRFLTYIQKQRPYIILKWAETSDGFVARSNYDSKWISNALSRKVVHKWRTEEDSILVGANTARYDNPSLTAREWEGKNPIRIVAEHTSQLPNNLTLFQGKSPALRYRVGDRTKEEKNIIQLLEDNYLIDLFQDLRQKKIQSIIVEGGAFVLHKLLEENLWDEIRLFRSTENFGEGIKAPSPRGKLISQQEILNDKLLIFRNISEL